MTSKKQPSKTDDLFDALGDRSRRKIVALVAATPCSISDLASALGITKTAIGQHVAALEACQLLRTEKRGRVRMCMLQQDGFNTLRDWVDLHKGHWEGGLDRLQGILPKEHRSAEE